MEFGRLSWDEISEVEFKLPVVHSMLTPTLNSSLNIGAAIWGEEKFRGSIYPADAAKKDFLQLYASQFNTVEVNSTFYALPQLDLIRRWIFEARVTNPQFKFCPKIPKSISHEGRLDTHFEMMPRVHSMLEAFEDNLGMTFLQLSDHFSPANIGVLINFLDGWPKAFKLGLELRHSAWFRAGPVQDKLMECLLRNNVSWVITDTPGRQEVLHQNFTARHVMIRFTANTNHPKDVERIQAWAKSFETYAQHGINEVYFLVHEELESAFLKPLVDLANLANLKIPVDYSLPQSNSQLSLF